VSTVEFSSVSKGYGNAAAVRDFSLNIRSGELVTLLGPSGCGKTTTLNLIAGFLQPDSGAIMIDGKSVSRLPAHRRNTAMVFQGYALFPHLTVARNVAFGLEVRKMPRDAITGRVKRALDLVHLSELADRYPRQLSGGQQQRVAIARALAIDPAVLLLDEPLSNLDAKLREEMRSEIRSTQKAVGITAIYVTHDQEEALAISDRIVVMNAGVIEQVGSPQEVYRKPRSAFVARFIGAANLIPVRVRSSTGGRTLVTTEDGLTFAIAHSDHVPDGTQGLLAIRPEHVSFTPGPRDENCIDAVVQETSFLGPVSVHALRVGAHLLRARAVAIEACAGTSVRIELPPERCIFIATPAS
jgi:putative spermidine/putrescine transport system ATP-binding protein